MRERDHLEGLCVDGRIILNWIFMKWNGAWIGLIWLRMGQVAGSCEHGNETSGFIKCEVIYE